MRLKSLYLLTVVASALFAAGCALGPYSNPNYDPNWPTIEPVGDLETVGNLRPDLLWYTETDEPILTSANRYSHRRLSPAKFTRLSPIRPTCYDRRTVPSCLLSSRGW